VLGNSQPKATLCWQQRYCSYGVYVNMSPPFSIIGDLLARSSCTWLGAVR
jgi:hypothetical protein